MMLVITLCLLLAAPVPATTILHHTGQDLQKSVDSAAPYTTIVCDRNEQITVDKTILITKPLTIRGLNAALVDSLGKTPILRVKTEGFAITDFELYGNDATVDQEVRAPLVSVLRGSFRVERGTFVNSSKDGVEINPTPNGGDIVGGVLRDLVGIGVVRDLVSIQGSGRPDGFKVRNILVENVRGIGSRLRGPVEVSDGSENITVRTVYAEKCRYAVDVQDHNKPWQINRNVVIEDVYAVDCRHAIRTGNRPFGHADLTIRDVVAERCTEPVRVSNTDGLTIENVRILEQSGDRPAFLVTGSTDVVIRDVSVAGTGSAAVVLLQNSSQVLVEGLRTIGDASTYANGLVYRVSEDQVYKDVRVRNVALSGTRGAAVTLDNTSEAGKLVGWDVDTH